MWPPAPESARAALIVAARRGLPGVPGAPVVDLGDDGRAVVEAARFDGMAGFLATAIADGAVAADDESRVAAVDAWRGALVGCVRVEVLLVRVAELLDGAGVRWRVTKGAAIAHLDYPDELSLRTFGDVDLVIHPADWSRALAALTSAGFSRPSPELRPGFDVRFGKGATLVDDDEMELDLHLRFAVGRFGVRAHTEELFGRADHLVLGGRRVLTLAGPDRLLHACHHLALGGFSGLRVARDVAQLLLVSDVDWERTVATADRWGVTAVVARGIVRAWDRLELGVAHPAVAWARGCHVGHGDARALQVFESERPFREQALTAIPALPVRRLPAYLLALAAPDAGSRPADGRSTVGHVIARLRKLLRGPRRPS